MQGKTLDANRYATKKTVSQGMLDVALLTANASQLKYVLQVSDITAAGGRTGRKGSWPVHLIDDAGADTSALQSHINRGHYCV